MDKTSAIVKVRYFANNPAHYKMNSRDAKILAGLLLLAAIGAGSAGIVLLRHNSPLFEATAAVRVVRDETDLEQLPAHAPAGLDLSVFLQNEVELCRSDSVLQKVVVQMELNEAWGARFNQGQPLATAESAARLKARVQVTPDPGSALLRIQTVSEVGLEATQLADALAAAYVEYRQERRQRLAQETIAALATAYQDNEAKVRRANELVAQAQAALDPALREQNPPPQPAREDDEALRAIRSRYTRATMAHLTLSNQLARSTSLPTNELQQLAAQVTRNHTELTNAETALQMEVKKQAALRRYWEARQELEKASLVFAPIQAIVAEKQHLAQSRENPPAVIEEAASAAIALPAHNAATGRGCLIGAGVLLLGSAGLWFQSRQPGAKVSS